MVLVCNDVLVVLREITKLENELRALSAYIHGKINFKATAFYTRLYIERRRYLCRRTNTIFEFSSRLCPLSCSTA